MTSTLRCKCGRPVLVDDQTDGVRCWACCYQKPSGRAKEHIDGADEQYGIKEKKSDA